MISDALLAMITIVAALGSIRDLRAQFSQYGPPAWWITYVARDLHEKKGVKNEIWGNNSARKCLVNFYITCAMS